MSRTFLLGAALVLLSAGAHAALLSPDQRRLTEIYKQLVEINTTHSVGDTTRAARAMAERFIAAGFPPKDVQVLVHPQNAQRGNLVVRLRGDGSLKPILLLAHLDVVEANKEDWSPELDPFKLVERDGFFYGRGSSDDKAMAAIFVANLIRYREQGLQLKRDIILALTADEEAGDFNGVDWLLKNHRALIDAQFGLNEGGGGRERNGKALFNGVQASEKVYRDFRLEVTNKGGHSSMPTKDNAISRLAGGLERLAAFDFPVELNAITRAFFEELAATESGQAAADMRAVAASNGKDEAAAQRLSQTPMFNAMLRTTCTATLLSGGHAPNALPQKATANVNCRILPSQSPDDVQRTLERVIADKQILISQISNPNTNVPPPSALEPAIMQPIEELTRTMWGVPTIPLMSTGANDSSYLRAAGIPVYGVSGLFYDIDDLRDHGRDERIGVKQFYAGHKFLFELVKRYATVTTE